MLVEAARTTTPTRLSRSTGGPWRNCSTCHNAKLVHNHLSSPQHQGCKATILVRIDPLFENHGYKSSQTVHFHGKMFFLHKFMHHLKDPSE
jgi:hypothetical protein